MTPPKPDPKRPWHFKGEPEYARENKEWDDLLDRERAEQEGRS